MSNVHSLGIQLTSGKAVLFATSFARFQTIIEESFTRRAAITSWSKTCLYPLDCRGIIELCKAWPKYSPAVQTRILKAFDECVRLSVENGQIEEADYDRLGVPPGVDEKDIDRGSLEVYRRRFCQYLRPSVIERRKAAIAELARLAVLEENARVVAKAEERAKGEPIWREYCSHGFLHDRAAAIEKLPSRLKRIEDIVLVLRFLEYDGPVSKNGMTKKEYLLHLLTTIELPNSIQSQVV